MLTLSPREGDDMMREKPLEASAGEAMTLQLEDLGSAGILRVLETVSKFGPLNISLLSRKTGLNHTSVDGHVKRLIEKGLVAEKRYGAIRMIKPAFDSFAVVFKRGMNVKLELSTRS